MIYNEILVRFGDLTLKGKNQNTFLRSLFKLVDKKMEGLDGILVEHTHDRIFIHLNGVDHNLVLERLDRVSGLSSYSLVVECNDDIETIKTTALQLMQEVVSDKPVTFKVDTKRANKQYPLHSMEITKIVSGYVLSHHNLLKVDVHNPEVELFLEVRGGKCYLYNTTIRAMGGYPVGIAGKGLLMLSGGIDSPVAGYMAMKQGIQIEAIHFESTPLTSIESAQKVVDLVKKMALYAPNNKIMVHMIPFKELHQAILEYVDDSYIITIMRRMMYRIATKMAEKQKCLCLINGESVGQVASQTLGSMYCINSVTNIPVLRPLVTFDKQDIISISKKIDCYDLSIKPFQDCCTVYLPKNPTTNPHEGKAKHYEGTFNFEEMVDWAVENSNDIVIDASSDLDLAMYGLEVRDVLKEYWEERSKNEGNKF